MRGRVISIAIGLAVIVAASALTLYHPAKLNAGTGYCYLPVRPVAGNPGARTFGTKVGSTYHNGVDYNSFTGNSVRSVGKGIVYKCYPSAGSFGAIDCNPKKNHNYNGPVVFVKYKLATGAPVYLIYGHSANSWVDNSKNAGNDKKFTYSCSYKITIKEGQSVGTGESFLKTSPFYIYNSTAEHLHLSVFLPNKKKNSMYYENPPSSEWGYSPSSHTVKGTGSKGKDNMYIEYPQGKYINPEDFFTKSQYALDSSIDDLAKL